jgi:hypothetical protein
MIEERPNLPLRPTLKANFPAARHGLKNSRSNSAIRFT